MGGRLCESARYFTYLFCQIFVRRLPEKEQVSVFISLLKWKISAKMENPHRYFTRQSSACSVLPCLLCPAAKVLFAKAYLPHREQFWSFGHIYWGFTLLPGDGEAWRGFDWMVQSRKNGRDQGWGWELLLTNSLRCLKWSMGLEILLANT